MMPFCGLKLKQKLKQNRKANLTNNISVSYIRLASYLMQFGADA